MKKFLDFHFWFNIRPGSLAPNVILALIVLLAVFLAISIISSLPKFKERGLYFKIWRKINLFAISNFVIGLFLLFFAYEALVMLSMRFFFLLWFLGIVVWLGFIIRDFTKIPELREKLKKEAEYKKYIP